MILYIIRGLPGSGKTTFARTLQGLIFEADQYFTIDGEYKYDASKIGDAHRDCRNRVEQAMKDGYPSLIVSNTFSRRWEIKPYLMLAKEHDYQAIEVTMSGQLHPNIHGVPDDVIQKMKDRWEA